MYIYIYIYIYIYLYIYIYIYIYSNKFQRQGNSASYISVAFIQLVQCARNKKSISEESSLPTFPIQTDLKSDY